MRLRVEVNGEKRFTSGIEGKGFLSAHLNMNNRKSDTISGSLLANGIETQDDNVSTHYEWERIELEVGDRVSITIEDSVPADEPNKKKDIKNHYETILSDPALAKKVFDYFRKSSGGMENLIVEARTIEKEEESKELAVAVGHVMTEIYERIYRPIWRKFPELIPEEVKKAGCII